MGRSALLLGKTSIRELTRGPTGPNIGVNAADIKNHLGQFPWVESGTIDAKGGNEDRPCPRTAPKQPTRKRMWIALSGVVLLSLFAAVWILTRPRDPPAVETELAQTNDASAPVGESPDIQPKTLEELLTLTPDQLAEVDVARMNLLCAEGLPGAEDLNIDRALSQLDDWALYVRFETDRHLCKFDRDPADYENSPGYFRMLMLLTVLQEDLGVKYNPDRIRDIDFRRSQDLFIHGMIYNDNGGTCASMPVLYVAVGRRLGYPLRLVSAKAHLFCRWDGPNERFNIEGSGWGLATYEDDHYKTWPKPISQAELDAGHYLVSHSPGDELACFLASRGHCLLDNGRTAEARAAYAAACRFSPQYPWYAAWQRQAESRLRGEALAAAGPPRTGRRPRLPRHDPLAQLRNVEAINAHNRRLMEQHMRPPTPPDHFAPQPPSPNISQPGIPRPYQPPEPRFP